MPPVAATPIMRYNGQTARNGQDRPLQTDQEIAIVPLSFSIGCFSQKNRQSYQIFLFFLVQMYYNSTTESIFVGL